MISRAVPASDLTLLVNADVAVGATPGKTDLSSVTAGGPQGRAVSADVP